MPTITDPTRLSKEELLAEWAVREEELRLQFESLNTAQTQSQVLLQRYERIFSYCPLPMLVIDSRAVVREVNRAARVVLPETPIGSTTHLHNLLDDASRLSLTQSLRSFCNKDAPVADTLRLVFREEHLDRAARLVALDAQSPPESYVLILLEEQQGDADLEPAATGA